MTTQTPAKATALNIARLGSALEFLFDVDQLDYVNHFRIRVLQDALISADVQYWLRRAQAFEDAAPRPGEYHGRATREQLSMAYQRCMLAARNCRRHAQLLREIYGEISDEVIDALGEVA